MSDLKDILPTDLVCLETQTYGDAPLTVDLAYARDDNTLFGERIYKPDAKLWMHKDLAEIVNAAAALVYNECGMSLILYDSLRPVEAQEAMFHTKRVQDNPEWLEAPAMLSTPGHGAHPRGMAIDLSLLDEHGDLCDMGTVFDFMSRDSSPQHNPAHREYNNHAADILERRSFLTDIMNRAAQGAGHEILPLPQEWWDYRLPTEIVNQYRPIYDAQQPAHMRMIL